MSQKILIAENQADQLETATSGLKAGGFEIMSAVSGLQALKHAGLSQPDLIILGPKLPDISGAVVCDIMRRLPSTAGIPIILITDRSDELARSLGAENGANICLSRPFSPQRLISEVKGILARWNESRSEQSDDWEPAERQQHYGME